MDGITIALTTNAVDTNTTTATTATLDTVPSRGSRKTVLLEGPMITGSEGGFGALRTVHSVQMITHDGVASVLQLVCRQCCAP